jgi:hypothetical protein
MEKLAIGAFTSKDSAYFLADQFLKLPSFTWIEEHEIPKEATAAHAGKEA